MKHGDRARKGELDARITSQLFGRIRRLRIVDETWIRSQQTMT
jgi:hypothetical protein